ncbi:hypothetical protein WAI453_006420 [Rhynchosporium graminicola]
MEQPKKSTKIRHPSQHTSQIRKQFDLSGGKQSKSTALDHRQAQSQQLSPTSSKSNGASRPNPPSLDASWLMKSYQSDMAEQIKQACQFDASVSVPSAPHLKPRHTSAPITPMSLGEEGEYFGDRATDSK